MKLFSKHFKKNWFRHLLQWGVLIAIIIALVNIFSKTPSDPEAYCPFGGLQAFGSYLTSETLACSMTTVQILMGLALGVGVILFGKLFCGYLCPVGLVSEYMFKLRKRIKVKGREITNGTVVDKVLRSIKYILLFIVFYMTLSTSELFCKNFDPYYAVASGFQGEITLWMSVAALVILFLGSFFFKLFWCKYICPLGALSNLFKFTIAFSSLAILYVIFIQLGLNIPWVYLLITACLMGYILEIIMVKPKVFPLIKVNRDEEKCTDCGLCTKKCPYSLPVDKNKVVKEVDCTLCGECISACSTNALTFNKKKSNRWLPAILTIVLFMIALILGARWEMPTINETWGDGIEDVDLKTFKMEGLSSVHCYGSSKAFSAKLHHVPGVYGVATFVKTHTANILYDPTQTSEEKILEATYTPVKFKIVNPAESDSLIKMITIYTEKMYDKLDPNHLGMQFRQYGNGKYFGIETKFSCPLTVHLYMDIEEPVDKEFLKNIVEKRQLITLTADGQENIRNLDFEFVKIGAETDTITRKEFFERHFNSYNSRYKENIKKFGRLDSVSLVISFPELDKPIYSRNLPYLSSYLSITEGVLSLSTFLDEDNLPSLKITYVPSVISDEKLWENLCADRWRVKMTNGEIKEVDAKLNFKNKR
ncbi:MAG TPA: 4Fe-4S binding protein [Petrimonas sp.]|uniref:4Fe-4S binding protein n=1 Tax=Petrimonas sp. TaxID=2023866 RepID=UPI0009629255|nr:4Fe-4S binding protein [Petrimonas sp.]MEA5044444.1 4Fe-4S binding protein [Petrimonas sp.]OJV38563.1 MAG: hypothetical protein BGO33_07200 [Bacteroidia bacterium 43-41]HHV84438.1 4Fe-4S binding protein [Petrimonas sp.]